MALFIVTGNYTSTAMNGMIANPSDRQAATTALIEAAGGRIVSYLMTTGETDFSMVIEADDSANVIPPLLVAGASNTVSNLKTVRAFTSAEFMAAQKKAGDIAMKFKPAG